MIYIILAEKLLLKSGIELLETDEIFKQVTGWNKYFISKVAVKVAIGKRSIEEHKRKNWEKPRKSVKNQK